MKKAKTEYREFREEQDPIKKHQRLYNLLNIISGDKFSPYERLLLLDRSLDLDGIANLVQTTSVAAARAVPDQIRMNYFDPIGNVDRLETGIDAYRHYRMANISCVTYDNKTPFCWTKFDFSRQNEDLDKAYIWDYPATSELPSYGLPGFSADYFNEAPAAYNELRDLYARAQNGDLQSDHSARIYRLLNAISPSKRDGISASPEEIDAIENFFRTRLNCDKSWKSYSEYYCDIYAYEPK